MKNLFLYIICLILGGAGAWLISHWGKALGLLDKPNERSSHEGLVPKGGGIGILAAFVVSSLLLNIPSGFWLPITFLALFSFCGDRIEFSPKFRLSLQFIAAIIFLFGINTVIQSRMSGFLLILAMAVFIVGTANFYNFMDGINGIAAITGIVGFGLFALYSFLSESYSSFAVVSVCIYFSCLGFLPFNIPKARVFMGDVGSILLGFTFAGMVVWLSKGPLDLICLAAFLFPFYADELTTMVVRIRDGDNLLRAHRRHLYQLLANEKGVSQWKISLSYGLVQLVVGVTVLLLKPFGGIMILSILIAYFIAFTIVSYFIRKNLTAT
jgi:UDP-N-acetylmuramyl pentapeptide phosphotransferase/UDP-N-acetylglucosamine-1-phosphate transferase